MIALRPAIAAALLLGATSVSFAQPNAGSAPSSDGGLTVFRLTELLQDPDLKAAAQKLANEPQVQKQLLDSLLTAWTASDDSLSKLINDLHLQPKLLKVKGSTGDTTLGLDYSYDRAMTNRVVRPESPDPLGLSFNLHAKGSVTADASKNPNNFLESGISLNLFQAIGGVEPMVAVTDAVKAETRALAVKATELKAGQGNLKTDPRYLAAVRNFSHHVTPQILWYTAGNATLESDQKFKEKQWAYGASAGLSVRDWRDESWASWLDLPDYPFALLRGLTDNNEPLFRPSGHSFPTFIVGVDLVDPKDNQDRLAADPDKSKYQRLRGEIAFKTKAAVIAGQPIWISASYRVYSEQGASAAIQAAKLDRFEYLATKLELGEKFFVTYTTGKLPLDRKSDQVYAFGYKFSL
jgi:hypothetical protein